MSDTFDHEGDAWASLDWLDGEDDSPLGFGYGLRTAPRRVRCNRCGFVGTWGVRAGRWFIAGGDGPHNCNAVQAGEFEDLTK